MVSRPRFWRDHGKGWKAPGRIYALPAFQMMELILIWFIFLLIKSTHNKVHSLSPFQSCRRSENSLSRFTTPARPEKCDCVQTEVSKNYSSWAATNTAYDSPLSDLFSSYASRANSIFPGVPWLVSVNGDYLQRRVKTTSILCRKKGCAWANDRQTGSNASKGSWVSIYSLAEEVTLVYTNHLSNQAALEIGRKDRL